jgi:enamine deaminase RidA (YjgF/YER057c/UK114 family)
VPRRSIASGSPYEARVGYSRAVRAGDLVFVAGTVAEGSDAYQQAKAAIAKIESALRQAGASLRDVVRTRLFVTKIEDWELVGRAHAEAFADIRPACTMVEVAALIAAEYLVEVEADAVVGDAPA